VLVVLFDLRGFGIDLRIGYRERAEDVRGVRLACSARHARGRRMALVAIVRLALCDWACEKVRVKKEE